MRHPFALLALLVSLAPHARPLQLAVQEFPPYSFTDQSKHLVGAYVEMVDAVCHEWPDGCTITQLPNLRARKLLEVGELDGMFPLARSPEREQSLRFSHPLGAASWGFFVHSESPEPALTRETLSGAIVGVTRNSFSQYLLEELDRRLQQQGNAPLHIRLNTTDSIHSLQKLTRSSRYQLYFSNVDVARYYLESGSHQDIRPLQITHQANYQVGFNKTRMNEAQLAAFDQILDKLEREGKFEQIRARWQLPAPLTSGARQTLYP